MEIPEIVLWGIGGGQLTALVVLIFRAGGAIRTQESHEVRLQELEDEYKDVKHTTHANTLALSEISGQVRGLDRDLTRRISDIDIHFKGLHESLHDIRDFVMKQGGETQIAMANAVRSISELASALARQGH